MVLRATHSATLQARVVASSMSGSAESISFVICMKPCQIFRLLPTWKRSSPKQEDASFQSKKLLLDNHAFCLFTKKEC
jgi:hypothetical protein